MAELRIESFAIEGISVFSSFLHQRLYGHVTVSISTFSPSLLSNRERSFTPFPLMKRTLAVSPCLPLLPPRKRFPLVSIAAGRTRACSSSLRASVLTHASARARSRGRAFSTRVCATRLRHGGSVACRNVRLKERLARTGSLPFPRRRPPKGVVSCISATTQSETMDRVLTARLSVKCEGSPGNGTSEFQVRECARIPLKEATGNSEIFYLCICIKILYYI